MGEEVAEALAVSGAQILVGGDEAEVAAGAEEIEGALVEIDEEIGGAGVAVVEFFELGFLVLDLLVADVGRVADD